MISFARSLALTSFAVLSLPGVAFAQATPSVESPAPVATASPTTVTPDAGPQRRHEGFYLRLGAGVGGALGRYKTPGYALRENNYVGTSLGKTAKSSLTGAGLAFDLALGVTVYDGLAIAGTLSVRTLGDGNTKFSGGAPEFGPYSSFGLFQLGVMADYYLDPRGGWHVQGGVAVTTLAHEMYSVRRDEPDTALYNGPAAHVGVGRDFFVSPEWSLGVLARVDGMYLRPNEGRLISNTFESSRITLVVPALLLTGTFN